MPQGDLRELVKKIESDNDVLAVILFGSYARNEKYRDIDVCLVMLPEKEFMGFDKKIEYSFSKELDVQIYQEMPLYVKKRILAEGKVLHCKNEDLLYDIAIKTVKEYELFRPKYELYIKGIADG